MNARGPRPLTPKENHDARIQLPDPQEGRVQAHRRGQGPHVRVRPHRVRPDPHRQRAHVPELRRNPPLPAVQGLRGHVCPEPDGRGRQDHQPRERGGPHGRGGGGGVLQCLHRADAPLRHPRPGHPPARHARDRGHAADDLDPDREGPRIRRRQRRRVLLGTVRPQLRHPLRTRSRPAARRRARRGERPEARPVRLCAVEGRQARRAQLAEPVGRRPPRLAHGVLRHDPPLPGHAHRHPRRRPGPGLPAPRERDRAGHVRVGPPACERVDAHGHAPRERREDVEVPWQLLHPEGDPGQVPRGRRAPAHAADPLPLCARLPDRPAGRCRRHAGAPAHLREEPALGRGQRAAGRRAFR